MKIIVLDSAPLSELSAPVSAPRVIAISQWASSHLIAGNRICVPEVIDYELRRELIRSGKTASIAELNAINNRFTYLPINTETMLLAADLWARSRNRGAPTGDPRRLDIDVILSAQAILAAAPGVENAQTVIATTNVRHLTQFVAADLWKNLQP
jgi:predicted nucleic acid-binding protein